MLFFYWSDFDDSKSDNYGKMLINGLVICNCLKKLLIDYFDYSVCTVLTPGFNPQKNVCPDRTIVNSFSGEIQKNLV